MVIAGCGDGGDGTGSASTDTHETSDGNCECASNGSEATNTGSGLESTSTSEPGCPDDCTTGDEPPQQCTDPLAPGAALWSGAVPAGAARSSWPTGFRDVNGDGFDDVVLREGYPTDHSSILVLFGPVEAADFDVVARVDRGDGFRIEPSGDMLGNAEIVGDMNGDGFADIAVAGTSEDGCFCGRDDGCYGSVTSSVYVVRGKADGTTVAFAELEAAEGGFAVHAEPSESVCGYAGAGILPLGDVDGDALADVSLVIQDELGLLLGSTTDASVSATELVEHGLDIRGPAGDVDDDGVADFVTREDQDFGGPALVTRLGGPDLAAGPVAFGAQIADSAPIAAGDVNGDGVPDLVVGVSDYSRVFVVFGRTDGIMLTAEQLDAGEGGFVIEYTAERQVQVFAAPGDFDGDGLADIAVTVPYHHQLWPTGRIFVVSGKADGSKVSLTTSPGPGVAIFEREGICAGAWGMNTVAAGDVHADGRGVLLNAYPGGSVALRDPD